MEEIRTFLESSTIHGLVYISTAKKSIVRSIWILVVIGGFSGASFLIYQSFQNWNQNPKRTTTETLPLKGITMPKVTVCPPKSTYTNLNYDLMMIKNKTLHDSTRTRITRYALRLIQDYSFNELMSNINLLQDENRYYNWYHGYSELLLPFWGRAKCNKLKDPKCGKVSLRYYLNTMASQGNISTQYFGEKFDAEKVKKDIIFHITIGGIPGGDNLTAYFEIDKIMINGIDQEYGSLVWLQNKSDSHYSGESNCSKEQTYQLYRKISSEEIYNLEMDQVPGFKIKWQHRQPKAIIPANMSNSFDFKR